MNSSFWKKTGRVWCSGLVLFGMRVIQNQTGFDPETGLALPSVAGATLVIGLVVLAALEVLFSLRLSKEKVDFEHHFAPPEKSLTALIIGCMMLVAGGILLAMEGVTAGGGIAAIVTGALALLTGGGFLILGRQMRAWDELDVTPTLPSLFFGVFLVLAVYLPTASDPILERYYLQVLAAAMVAYAFGRLAGFLRKESSHRSFTPVGNLAVMTSIAAIADGGKALSLLFGGCAVVLSVFLALQGGYIPSAEDEEAGESEENEEAEAE